MLILDGKKHVSGLGFPCHYTVILPNSAVSGVSCPMILCLHDLGEGREDLLYQMQLPVLVDEFDIALMIPDGRRSCFLDMAHGPAWATFFAEDQIRSMQHDFRLRADITGVIGIGAGALGALQICRHMEVTRFICAVIEPAMDVPFIYNKTKWTGKQEWLSVFDGQDELWTPDCFQDTTGCVIGTEDQIKHCTERLQLSEWQQQIMKPTRREAWRQAVSWCVKNLCE